jgi:hypothetical protein
MPMSCRKGALVEDVSHQKRMWTTGPKPERDPRNAGARSPRLPAGANAGAHNIGCDGTPSPRKAATWAAALGIP